MTRKLKWQTLFELNILYTIGKLFQHRYLKWCLIFEVMNIKLSKNEKLGAIFPTLFLPWAVEYSSPWGTRLSSKGTKEHWKI